MSDNTQAPPAPDPQPPTDRRQGFILDAGPCCYKCLDGTKEDENVYALPWLYEGEHYDCIRCRGKFVNVG